MAPKKKVAAAPTSEKAGPNIRRPDGKKTGQPTRAEKKAANSKAHARGVENSRKIVASVKAAGHAMICRPYEPAKERFWRKPDVEWSEELADDLFVLMCTGNGMNAISKLDGMPSVYQMMRWLNDEAHPFGELRARAKNHMVPYFEEIAQEITLSPVEASIVTKRQILDKDGDVREVVEERIVDGVERSKLAFEGLKWTLGHLMPKKHGRNAAPESGEPNDQLKGLFAALKAGPKE